MPFSIGSGGSGVSPSLCSASSTSVGHFRDLLRRREGQIDRLVDVAFHRLERHHAGLSDPRPHTARDMVAAAALRRHIEGGLCREHLAQIADIGDRLADGLVGLEVAMQARVRDLRDRHRDAPRIWLQRIWLQRIGFSVLLLLIAPASTAVGTGNFAEPLNSVASSRPSRAAMAASA